MKKTILSMALAFVLVSANAQNELVNSFITSYDLEKAGKYKEAIDALRKNYSESVYEINLRMGWLHYMSGLFSESTTYYQKAIALMPRSIEAKMGLVLPAAALGKWDQVETQYREVLKIDAQNTTANYRLGLILYGKKDYANAAKYFSQVANLYPFDYDSMIMLAWSNYFLNKPSEAKVLFQKCLLAKPNDASATEGLTLLKK